MSSNNDIKDFELLYKSLKAEYDQNKEFNDEICKEYESTIEILSQNNENYKKEIEDFKKKINKYDNDIKIISKEKENLIKKNKDKLIDIQYLNEQNEKLNEILKKYKDEKSIFDSKIVSLENDIEHYQNKKREYEDFIEELKSQLENALEENITLQTEFETYKLNASEQIMRKDDEIKEIRSDIIHKDNIIKQMNCSQNEKFNIQKIQQKLINDKKYIRGKRRCSVFENKYNRFNFLNIQNNSINNNLLNNNNLNINTNKILNFSESNTPREIKGSNYSEKKRSYFSNYTFNIDNNLLSSPNTEKKNMKTNNEMNGLNAITEISQSNNINKFENLFICEDNKISFNSMNNKYKINIYRNEEYKKELQNMLIRIKQRKNMLYNLKKNINEKLEKLLIKGK